LSEAAEIAESLERKGWLPPEQKSWPEQLRRALAEVAKAGEQK
jgi:hypothetical protein